MQLDLSEYNEVHRAKADPEIFERGDPEPLKMTFDCFFQSFSNKSFVNIPPKGGGGFLIHHWCGYLIVLMHHIPLSSS